MTIPAQGSVVSFAMQPAKIGEDGSFTIGSYSWHKFRTPRAAFAPVQGQQIFPPEVGGPLTAEGTYKDSAFFGGDFDLLPRMESSLGWFLLGALGNASTVLNKDSDGNVLSGVNSHIFQFDPSNGFSLPWMAFRRHIPGVTSPDDIGEVGFDSKIASLRLTMPAAGKLAARFNVVGREFFMVEAPSWSYANASYEDSLSTPESGAGYVKIGGTSYPVMGATLDIVNGLTSPQQEMIIGSFHPDDFVPLQRACQIRFVYKYENPDLYQQIFNNGAGSVDWSNTPFIKVTSGQTYAFDAVFKAPTNIPGTSTPYQLRLRANRITLAQDGPIQLVGGGILAQTLVATLLTPASGPYFQAVLNNAQADYVIS